jgi:hypothetical protein
MKTGDRGQVLIIVALAIVALVGAAALAVDVAYLYSVRHELQRCADSGALAGASRWIEPGSAWSPNPLDPVMIQAENRARDFASRDPVVQTPLDRDGEVAVAFPQVDRIRVDTTRTVDLFFARIFGSTNRTITAYAIARGDVSGTPPVSVVRLVE